MSIRIRMGLLTLAVVGVGTVPACSQTIRVQTRDGQTFQAESIQWAGDRIQIQAADGAGPEISIADLSQIRFGQTAADPDDPLQRVVCRDGSILMTTTLSMRDNQLTGYLGSDPGAAVTVSTREVDYLQWSVQRGSVADEQLQELLQQPRSGDALVVVRDGAWRAIEGVVRSIQMETAPPAVTFAVGDRAADIPLDRTQAILFFHARDEAFEPPLAEVQMVGGSTLQARRLTSIPGGVRVIMQTGVKVDVAAADLLAIRFGAASSIALTDLKPATNDWQPLLANQAIVASLRALNQARLDVGFAGQPLAADGERVVPSTATGVAGGGRGLAIRGGGRVAFQLAGRYQQLTGRVGFAPDADLAGVVRLRLLGDGRSLWERELAHATIAEPVPLEVSVVGIQRLVIQCEYADGRSVGDVLHLVDMRLSQ